MAVAVEAIGWVAALMILGAYWLLTTGRVDARSPLYQWLNVLGAAGFILNSGYNGAYPSAVLNVVWAGIGIYALWAIARSRRAPPAV
nr:hypothetical protein [Allosphingosinicella indica]